MRWKVIIEDNVNKFLKNLKNKVVNKKFDDTIQNFKINPYPRDKNCILDINKNKYLCEFKINNLRFYYEIHTDMIIINSIEYKGKVSINYAKKHKSGLFGKWNRQRDFINWIKKKFKKN